MQSKQLSQYDDVDIPDGIENISDPDLDENYIEPNFNKKIPRGPDILKQPLNKRGSGQNIDERNDNEMKMTPRTTLVSR